MIRFMVVTHEMEEQFIRQQMCPLRELSFPYLNRIPNIEELWQWTSYFFFLQLNYCLTSFVTTLVLGFISLCYLKKIILINKMNVDVFVAFKSYGSEWVK